MSLLNDMLRGLDSRRQSPGTDSGIQIASSVVRRRTRPAVWLIISIFIIGLGAVFTLDHYQLLDQTGLPVSTAPVQSDDPVSVEDPSVRPALNSQVEARTVRSNDGIAEITRSQSLLNLPEDAAKLSAEQSQHSVSQPQPETSSPSQIAGAPPPGQTPGPSSSPAVPEGNPGATSILRQPTGFYTVQLIALRDQRKMLNYARDIGLKDPLYAPIRTRGHISNVLLLGVYPDRLAAVQARNEFISTRNLSVKPWIRKLGPLQEAIAGANELIDTPRNSGQYQNDTDKEIQQLLQDAELALMRERLTSPAEDNAYNRYRRVLDLVPDHPAALAGIDEIVRVYLDKADGYLDSNDFERAQRLVERAQRVGGPSPEIALMNEQLAAETSARQDMIVAPEAIPALGELDSMEINVRQQSAGSKTEQGILLEVEDLLQRHAETEARFRLEQFLVAHPDSVVTIEVLFRLYLRLDDPDMAQRLLDHSSHLPFLKSIELGAQLKVQQGDLIDAVKMLERATPNYEASSYYALLAGLYQKLGRFTEAASHYRHLLNNEPERGAYWLGLAVSLDSLQQYQEALVAFQRTRDSGQYDGDVQEYIEQRISALSR